MFQAKLGIDTKPKDTIVQIKSLQEYNFLPFKCNPRENIIKCCNNFDEIFAQKTNKQQTLGN